MAQARVLLLLSGRPEPPSFARSVCGLLGLGPGPGPWRVYCGLERGRLLLSDRSFSGATAQLPLQRPRFCPFSALEQRPPAAAGPKQPPDRGVDLGVAVLLQSRDQSVLLTRRASSMHTAPNLWVPPGEPFSPPSPEGEVGTLGSSSWPSAALSQPHSAETLSAYPPMLNQGYPRYHHIVLYILVTSQETEQQLQERIQPNREEVSAYAWLKPDVLAAVAASEDGPEMTEPLPQYLPPFVQVMELQGDVAQSLDLPLSTLLRTSLNTRESEERVSMGTKFALGLWLQHLKR
uniref:Nudix hydrolase domain-containing protein n=1 Tax=Vombatus ursinus TaxID=29139 RepID=A0A4X2JUW0_VOMUR